jgi:endonuclease YncB( thermonuclease family)
VPCAYTSAYAAAYDFLNVKVTRVYDGDTIHVDIPQVGDFFGKDIGVRVKGIDAPEMKSNLSCERSAALRAKALVESTIKGASRVDLLEVDKDKYFRLLAVVNVDGINLSNVLLKARLAVPYFGEAKQSINWCKK